MKNTSVILLLSVVCLVAKSQSYTVESVPNTKLVNNSYVSDPTNILHDTTIQRINRILGDLENQSTAQVAVVMLPSIGNEEHVDFSQRLFRYWGIGQAGKDNGLLILFIMDQRTIRFHTGYGLEGVLPDVICKRIQQRHMVPYFKEGDYNTGVLRGIEAVAAILLQPEAVEEILARDSSGDRYVYFGLGFVYALVALVLFLFLAIGGKFKKSYDAVPISAKRWFILYLILPIIIFYLAFESDWPFITFFLTLYGLIIALFLERYYRTISVAGSYMKDGHYQDAYNFLNRQKTYWIVAAVLFFVPMIVVYQMLRRKRDSFRNYPRTCKQCQATLIKLTEETEDEFLKSGQIAEEKVGTIDYDVWRCNTCGSTEILRYPNPKTNYTHCPKCNFLTYHLGAKRTIQSATYQSDGHGEEERNCYHCGHHHVDKFIIPMLVASSSDSSSSSSSDSGGSWGGGDSGGGGASSSW